MYVILELLELIWDPNVMEKKCKHQISKCKMPSYERDINLSTW